MLLLLFTHECKCTYAHTPKAAATKKKNNKIVDRITQYIAYSVYGTAMNADTKERTKRTVNEGERKTITRKKCNKKIMRVMFWCKCRSWWKKNLAISMIAVCVCECVNFKWNTCIDCQSHKPKHTIWNGKRLEATKKNQLHKRTYAFVHDQNRTHFFHFYSICELRVCLTCRAMHV